MVAETAVDSLAEDDRWGLDKKAGDKSLEDADKLVAVGRNKKEGAVEESDVEIIVAMVVVGGVGYPGSRGLAYVDYAYSWCLPKNTRNFIGLKLIIKQYTNHLKDGQTLDFFNAWCLVPGPWFP